MSPPPSEVWGSDLDKNGNSNCRQPEEKIVASQPSKLAPHSYDSIPPSPLMLQLHPSQHPEVCKLIDKSTAVDDAKFVRLQNELFDNTDKFFVFVSHPHVEATNNRSERQARGEAMARKAARTSKTKKGAKRRGVIMSVLASLSKRLEHFTLANVLSEINRWLEMGHSVFHAELAELQQATSPPQAEIG